jgi:hypothetical protein
MAVTPDTEPPASIGPERYHGRHDLDPLKIGSAVKRNRN